MTVPSLGGRCGSASWALLASEKRAGCHQELIGAALGDPWSCTRCLAPLPHSAVILAFPVSFCFRKAVESQRSVEFNATSSH